MMIRNKSFCLFDMNFDVLFREGHLIHAKAIIFMVFPRNL